MARPNKVGLDYFPFDIDFFNDEKIEAISGEFGIKGEIATVKLLCAIYRNGYFILWDELMKMKLLKSLPSVSSELLDRIVYRLVLWGFFDKSLFDSVKVLTSRGIQNRYFEAIKRRKGFEQAEYLLINVCNNNINVSNNEINANSNQQSKVKESKRESVPPIIPHDKLKPVIDTSEIKSLLLSDNEWKWKEQMCQQSGLSIKFMDMLPDQIDNFLSWIQVIGEEGTILKIEDAKRRFYYWWRDTGHKEWKQLNSTDDDKRRANAFKPTATNPNGKIICSETEQATSSQSAGSAHKDYSGKF